MKKLSVFSLLFVFLFNSVGYYVTFSISRAQIRKEVKTRMKLALPSEELTIIEFAKADIPGILWEKENKEFFYKNQLFDIVKKVETSSSVIFHCINDQQETELFASLEEFINLFVCESDINDGTDKKTSSKKAEDPSAKYFSSGTLQETCLLEDSIASFRFTAKNYQPEFFEIKSPPPEF